MVANIDTGVDFNHPALKRQYRGRKADGTFDHNYNWYDPASICGSPSLAPCDNAGHGTHTMGIIVGEDENDPAVARVGVAPRARWIAAKGCESGDCSLSSLLRAGEWMLAPTDLHGANPRPDLRPHIVNNSWSAGTGDDVFFQKVVKAWVAAGIFPVFASGNDGPTCNSADSPADYPESYAVGAHDSENHIAPFSSRGSTALGGVKPNISAPGVNIRSSIPGGAYGFSNGTSMATPHVSGAVALIWSAAPSLMGDIAGTRALLDQTAIDTEDLSCGGTAEDNNVFGQGRLNVLAAVSQAPRSPTGTLQGIVQAVSDGRTLAARDATVRAQGPADRRGSVDANGAYGLVVPHGRYQVTVSAFGYVTQTTEVVVTQEERTLQNFVLEPAPSHVVRGIVRQADGRPLAGARVNIEGTPLLAAISDQNGAYTLQGVPAGQLPGVRHPRRLLRQDEPLALGARPMPSSNLVLPRRTDYYGYYCEPLRAGFIDASQVLPLQGQRGSITVPLPFSFSFYGRIYQQAEVSSTGYLSFGPGSGVQLSERAGGRNGIARIPDGQTPNGAVYAFWDDLVVDEAASVRTETVGTAPHRAFVVEWRNVAFRDQPELRVRFEIVLHEDGRILTQYFTAGPAARQQGASATVGLEDAGWRRRPRGFRPRRQPGLGRRAALRPAPFRRAGGTGDRRDRRAAGGGRAVAGLERRGGHPHDHHRWRGPLPARAAGGDPRAGRLCSSLRRGEPGGAGASGRPAATPRSVPEERARAGGAGDAVDPLRPGARHPVHDGQPWHARGLFRSARHPGIGRRRSGRPALDPDRAAVGDPGPRRAADLHRDGGPGGRAAGQLSGEHLDLDRRAVGQLDQVAPAAGGGRSRSAVGSRSRGQR